MNRGFVFILILAVGLVVTSCLRQGKQNVTYDFTPLDSIISTWMDKGYYPGGAICVIMNDSVFLKRRMALSPEIQKCMSLLPASGWLLP